MAGEIPWPARTIPAATEVSGKHQALLGALEHGQLFWFADWPVAAVPRSGALVYTVWRRSSDFIYVGIAGRGETSSARGFGPFGRLASHASGRRSGDQFCVYVCGSARAAYRARSDRHRADHDRVAVADVGDCAREAAAWAIDGIGGRSGQQCSQCEQRYQSQLHLSVRA